MRDASRHEADDEVVELLRALPHETFRSMAAAALAVGAALPMLYATVAVMGPLAVAGYDAFVGTTVGSIRSLRLKDAEFAAMVQDAVREGCCALVVHCPDEGEQRRAGELLDRTVARDQIGQ